MTSIDKVVFYNLCANGDLHLSRGLVRHVMSTLPAIEFGYIHARDACLLSDIPRLRYEGMVVPGEVAEEGPHGGALRVGSALYMNTWYHANGLKNAGKWGYTHFDTLFSLFDDMLRDHFGMALPNDAAALFPAIDFDRFEIGKASAFVASEKRPLVFVSNGMVTSQQAVNFDLSSMVREVAAAAPWAMFLLTEEDSQPETDNVRFTGRIIDKSSGSDLNENAFLASKSDMIVGRASGPFTFAMTRENLFERDVRWVCFSTLNYPRAFWLGELFRDVRYRSDIRNYPGHQRGYVVEKLRFNLDMLKLDLEERS